MDASWRARRLTFVLGAVVSLTWMGAAASVAGAADASALRLAAAQPALELSSGRMATATAAVAAAGAVELTQSCAPQTIVRREQTQCQVTAVNNSFEDVVVDFDTRTSQNLHIVGSDRATLIAARHAQLNDVTLAGAKPGVPSVDPGTLVGYLPLDAFGITPTPIGDEQIINFNVPPFVYAGQTWASLGVDSNGYIVVGGGTAEDNNCCNLPAGPDPARPNNVLAPFWTDLDGTGAPGIFVAVLTDGVDSWIVVEFRLNLFGTTSRRVFQTWIGINGVEDITYAYDPANLPGAPGGQPFLVGAENALGQGDMGQVLPTQDLRVSTSAPTPGGSTSYTLHVRGQQEGAGTVTTQISGLSEPVVAQTAIEVLPKKP